GRNKAQDAGPSWGTPGRKWVRSWAERMGTSRACTGQALKTLNWWRHQARPGSRWGDFVTRPLGLVKAKTGPRPETVGYCMRQGQAMAQVLSPHSLDWQYLPPFPHRSEERRVG